MRVNNKYPKDKYQHCRIGWRKISIVQNTAGKCSNGKYREVKDDKPTSHQIKFNMRLLQWKFVSWVLPCLSARRLVIKMGVTQNEFKNAQNQSILRPGKKKFIHGRATHCNGGSLALIICYCWNILLMCYGSQLIRGMYEINDVRAVLNYIQQV